MVRETSTWRIAMSHQYPPARSASVNGSGSRAHQRSQNPAMVPGPRRVADPLQPGRVVGGGEPVVQLGEPDPRRGGGAFGVLVAVEPDLARVREIRAHLDERRPEHLIDQIEVVGGDPAVGLVIAEPRHPATLGVQSAHDRRPLSGCMRRQPRPRDY